MLAGERAQVLELTGKLHHQITVISAGLEARAAELSAVLDSVRDAVLVVREDGHVVRVNEPARAFFGDTANAPDHGSSSFRPSVRCARYLLRFAMIDFRRGTTLVPPSLATFL